MKKYLGVALAAVFALALAAPVFAQDNVSGLGAYEGADGSIFIGLTATDNYFAVRYQCKDFSLTSTTRSAAVADCCIAGDIWRATIWAGNVNKTFRNVANTAQFAAGGPAFAPGVFSPDGGFGGKGTFYILATMGNQTPGGLPAGATLRVTTNAGNATCTKKQFYGGS